VYATIAASITHLLLLALRPCCACPQSAAKRRRLATIQHIEQQQQQQQQNSASGTASRSSSPSSGPDTDQEEATEESEAEAPGWDQDLRCPEGAEGPEGVDEAVAAAAAAGCCEVVLRPGRSCLFDDQPPGDMVSAAVYTVSQKTAMLLCSEHLDVVAAQSSAHSQPTFFFLAGP
jgi:hypothetical protein